MIDSKWFNQQHMFENDCATSERIAWKHRGSSMVSASLACLCSDSVVYQIDILGRKTFFNAGKVHERSWKYHVHPCAFLFGLVEGSRGVFSTFFCQARRNARLCPQKIRRLWISKQSKQDIHKISYNFIVIGNSFFKTFFMNHMGDSLISRIRIDVPRPWASSIYRAARYFRCGPIVWHPWFCRNYAIWFVKKM